MQGVGIRDAYVCTMFETNGIPVVPQVLLLTQASENSSEGVLSAHS